MHIEEPAGGEYTVAPATWDVDSKVVTWSGLATDVAISKLDGAELLVGPGWFTIVGDGERKRVRGFLATLLGEKLPEFLTADSEDLESLAGSPLLMILNAADIVEELWKFCTK
jgi:hypothetical protein